MWIDEAETSGLVERALPLLPFLSDGDEFSSYALLLELKSEAQSRGDTKKIYVPEEWSARISGPLLSEIVEIGHKQVMEALRTVAFNDRQSSPWGRVTGELLDWLMLPDGDDSKLADFAAAAVLLAALYGEQGHFLLPTDESRPE